MRALLGLFIVLLLLPLAASASTLDTDGDGYTDDAEKNVYNTSVSTADNWQCGTFFNGWPSDIITGGVPDSTDKINILDLTSFSGPVRRYDADDGTHPATSDGLATANYDNRWDLHQGNGTFSHTINIQDVTEITTGARRYPPMSGGTDVYNTGWTCPPSGHHEGRLRFFKKMNSDFDPYESDTTFANAHYDAAGVYPLSSNLGGSHDRSFYTAGDMFAYLDWVRKGYDTNQNISVTNAQTLTNLAGSPCYYYGHQGDDAWRYMDAGNTSFRGLIKTYFDTLFANGTGYDGIYLDDVNLGIDVIQCGSASCDYPFTSTANCPKNPDTGNLMTADEYADRTAGFTEYIRYAFPHRAILHNAQPCDMDYVNGGCDETMSNGYRTREIKASDLQEIEHGCLVPWKVTDDILAWAAHVHALNTNVFEQGYDPDNPDNLTDAQRDYGVACHLLFNVPGDYYGSFKDGNPPADPVDGWNAIYDTDLGYALGPYYAISGGYRRDFSLGYVTVNTSTRVGVVHVN